jgi:Ribbon-helix-helix protein, copG family
MMQRTNIYLDERQVAALRSVSERRGESVAALVRSAVDAWLEKNGVREIPSDEWQQRFDALLDRRGRSARRLKPDPARVERDVAAAVAEVRSARRR